MNIPCARTLDCPGSDWPTLNLSAEDPDRLYFFQYTYPDPDFRPPPIPVPVDYYGQDCYGNVFSVQSQEVADLLSQITSTYCNNPNPPPNPNNPDEPAFCYNESQTVNKVCPDGTTVSYTAPAGMFVNQIPNAGDPDACLEASNAKALAYAKQQLAKLTCPEITCSINTSTPLPSGNVGAAYSTTISGSLGTVSYWSVTSGSLPPGLSLNPLTGVISGTPTTAGTYTFTIGLKEKSAAPVVPPVTPTTPTAGYTPTATASVSGIALYVNAAHLVPGKNYSVSMELSAFGTDWYAWTLPVFTAVGTDYGSGVTWAYVDPTRFYGTYTTQGFVRNPAIIMVV